MSVAAKTMFIFGVYLGLFGLSMIFTPNLVASLFDVTFELWMARVIGVIQICIAIHYFIAVYEENMSFFIATVRVRPILCLCFITLAVLDLMPATIILAGFADLLVACITGIAIRRDNRGILR